jgi:3-deoxy-D-manno-octulosonate 8-phosphate phosphatase KdsC-like HAD superfamily phosphatase
MKAYVCVQCGWEYRISPALDRVNAVRRHQLGHVLERRAGTGAVRDVLDALMLDTGDAGELQVEQRPLAKTWR